MAGSNDIREPWDAEFIDVTDGVLFRASTADGRLFTVCDLALTEVSRVDQRQVRRLAADGLAPSEVGELIGLVLSLAKPRTASTGELREQRQLQEGEQLKVRVESIKIDSEHREQEAAERRRVEQATARAEEQRRLVEAEGLRMEERASSDREKLRQREVTQPRLPAHQHIRVVHGGDGWLVYWNDEALKGRQRMKRCHTEAAADELADLLHAELTKPMGEQRPLFAVAGLTPRTGEWPGVSVTKKKRGFMLRWRDPVTKAWRSKSGYRTREEAEDAAKRRSEELQEKQGVPAQAQEAA